MKKILEVIYSNQKRSTIFSLVFFIIDFFGVNTILHEEEQQQHQPHTRSHERLSTLNRPNSSVLTPKPKRLTYEKRLIQDLLNNYPTIYARPIRNVSQPLEVTFGLTLTQLFDLGSTGQIMQTNTWKTLMWKDMNLVWNESHYGGLKTVCLPADSIWTPVRNIG